MKHFKRLLICGAVLLGLWLVYQQLPIPTRIRVSQETTYLTEPLADDGLPDYAGALLAELRAGVTPENNGAIPYLRAMWPADLDPEHQPVICQELGMEVPQQEGMRSPDDDEQLQRRIEAWLSPSTPDDEESEEPWSFDEWNSSRQESENKTELLLDLVRQQPWTPDQAPMVAEWVAAHREQYDLLHEAVARPKFYCPSPSLLVDPKGRWIDMLLPTAQSLRNSARCLAVRANLYIGQGKLDAASEDCRAIFKLSDSVVSSTIVEDLVSIGIEGMGNEIALNLLDNPLLSEADVKKLHVFFAGRPLRLTLADAMNRGERMIFITSILAYSRQREGAIPIEESEAHLTRTAAQRVNWNRVLRIGNQWYDRLVDLNRVPRDAAREEAFDSFEQDLEELAELGLESGVASLISREARSENIARIFISLMMPAVNAANTAQDRRNIHRQLMPVAAALAVYRAQHGRYPESLGSLTPSLLPKAPTDLFHDAPFVYQQTDNGYLLYSLGENQQDDQGCNAINGLYRGYVTRERNNVEGRDEAVVAALGKQDDPSLYDEDGEGPYLRIPNEADDHAIRLPLPKIAWPTPSEVD